MPTGELEDLQVYCNADIGWSGEWNADRASRLSKAPELLVPAGGDDVVEAAADEVGSSPSVPGWLCLFISDEGNATKQSERRPFFPQFSQVDSKSGSVRRG